MVNILKLSFKDPSIFHRQCHLPEKSHFYIRDEDSSQEAASVLKVCNRKCVKLPNKVVLYVDCLFSFDLYLVFPRKP